MPTTKLPDEKVSALLLIKFWEKYIIVSFYYYSCLYFKSYKCTANKS